MILASLADMFFGTVLCGLSIFLILLVLVQRGKGGGLTGALGGPGGQSAFGSKAGDLFMKITAGVAIVWITMCGLAVWSLGNVQSARAAAKAAADQKAELEGVSVDDVTGAVAGDLEDEGTGDSDVESSDETGLGALEGLIAPKSSDDGDAGDSADTSDPETGDESSEQPGEGGEEATENTKPEEKSSDASDGEPTDSDAAKPEEGAPEDRPAEPESVPAEPESSSAEENDTAEDILKENAEPEEGAAASDAPPEEASAEPAEDAGSEDAGSDK